MSKNILIIGATSDISSGVIEHLKNSGHRLKALVRNPAKAKNLERLGVELRVGDLEKPWTLGAAFEGADTAWLLTPPGPRAPEQSSNALGQREMRASVTLFDCLPSVHPIRLPPLTDGCMGYPMRS
jgi:uncharacterized protein YbjT (DUF2867 family)